MNNLLFSILVANYNNGKFFKDCYISIINQTYKNWEVIIVDDCSTDNSVELIKSFIKNDTRFKLFTNQTNRGCGYAKNKCAEFAVGDVLGFLDPDDAITDDALQIMVAKHNDNPDVAIITSKYDFVDLNMNFKKLAAHGSIIPSGKSYLTFGEGAFTHFATFKMNFYNQTIGIDSKMKRAVDQDLYLKLEEQGKHLFINKVLYHYRIQQNSISANQNLYKAQYWHFYTIVNSYKRRKQFKLPIDNLTTIQIKKIKSNYYFSRFERAKLNKQFCMKLYFFLRSIIAYPRYNIKYKLKLFFNK